MSQFDFATIDPNAKSGTQLAVDLNNWRDALHSGHRGAGRPSYATAGMLWVRETSAEQWDLMFYDGDTDFVLRSVNPTTNELIGIPQSSIANLVGSLLGKQPLDPVLTALADQTTLAAADAAAARTTIGAMANADADFAIIYPNGGTAAAPANITTNTRYVEVNPFPGHLVICKLEVKPSGYEWGEIPGQNFVASFSTQTISGCGATASQYGNDIVIQTGSSARALNPANIDASNPFGSASSINWPLPARVKVWKVKGAA